MEVILFNLLLELLNKPTGVKWTMQAILFNIF
jgi:hypothetical protein